MKETLRVKDCVRCGKCLPHCPSYRVFQREDHSPRGRNVLLSKGVLGEGLAYCLLCQRCEKVCPLGVSFPQSYLEYQLSKPFLNLPLSRLRDPLFLKEFGFKKKAHSLDPSVYLERHGDLYLYLSCGVRHLYPESLEFLGRALQKAKLKLEVPNAKCCGILCLSFKDFEGLRKLAEEKMSLFPKDKPILTLCATCLWMMKVVYPLLSAEFKPLAERTYYALDLLPNLLGRRLTLDNQRDILLHKPCHLVSDLTFLPLDLNNNIKDFCCGSARADLWLKGFQQKYSRRWIKELQGIRVLATTCTGCYLTFSTLIKKPPLVKHWLEVLRFI